MAAYSREEIKAYIQKRIREYEKKLKTTKLTETEKRKLNELYRHQLLLNTKHWTQIAGVYAQKIEQEQIRNQITSYEKKILQYNRLISQEKATIEHLKRKLGKEFEEDIIRMIQEIAKRIEEEERKRKEYKKKKKELEKKLKGQTS